jgi:hypothetical protein
MWRKRDAIFWAATGVFIIAVALGAAVDERFYLLMVVSYLLRPTVHSLGFARTLVDERQLAIHYQAGNVAFAVMVIGNIVVMLYLMSQDDHTYEKILLVLFVALATRALVGLLKVGDPAVAGPRILMAVGLLMSLFGVLEGPMAGALVRGAPGLVLVALGVAARKRPVLTAYLSFGTAAVAAVLFGALMLRGDHAAWWGKAAAALFVISPIVVAAFCLLRGAEAGGDERPPPGN